MEVITSSELVALLSSASAEPFSHAIWICLKVGCPKTFGLIISFSTSLIIILICFPSKVIIFRYTRFLDVGPTAIAECFRSRAAADTGAMAAALAPAATCVSNVGAGTLQRVA